jgi:hypothetical protein
MKVIVKFICATLVASSCSSLVPTENIVNIAPIEIAQHEYVGTWVGTYEGEPFFDVTITNNTFVVYWTSDSNAKPLYWAGTFDSSRLVSVPDEKIMNRLLKTSKQQKEIVLVKALDGLTFTVNLIGINQTINMKKV